MVLCVKEISSGSSTANAGKPITVRRAASVSWREGIKPMHEATTQIHSIQTLAFSWGLVLMTAYCLYFCFL